MRSNCILLVLTFLSFNGWSQAEDVTNVAKVTFLNPGLGYELRIGKFQTLHAQVFANPSLFAEENGFGSANFSFYLDPAATLQYRYYYNNSRRLEREKRTDKNSMNYLAFVGELIYSKVPLQAGHFEEAERRPINRVGVVWGLQRNFEKHFSLDLNLGLGFLASTRTTFNGMAEMVKMNVSQPTFMGQLNLGFWFGGK